MNCIIRLYTKNLYPYTKKLNMARKLCWTLEFKHLYEKIVKAILGTAQRSAHVRSHSLYNFSAWSLFKRASLRQTAGRHSVKITHFGLTARE